jgi:hypothetical protein
MSVTEKSSFGEKLLLLFSEALRVNKEPSFLVQELPVLSYQIH